MASPDDAATDQFRDLTDAKVTLAAEVYTVAPTLLLEYGAGIEVPFVYRFSSLASYFTYAFPRDAALSAQMQMALTAAITLGTFGLFMF